MLGSTEKHQLNKLQVGYCFTYNKQIWDIIEVGEYHWKTGEIGTEYSIESNGKKAFLEVEFYKGEYELCFSEQITIQEVFLEDAIESETIMYKGKEFELDETYQGSYKSLTNRSTRERLSSYLFYNKKKMITIEKWENSYEVFYGEEVKKKNIKAIKKNRA